MAIDMLEDNEMGALAPSRLGLKNFVDDVPVRGKKMTNKEEQFEELFGTKRRKKGKAALEDLKSRLSQLPKDCQSIDSSISILQEGYATAVKQAAAASGPELKRLKREASIYQGFLGEYKKVKASSCAQLEAQQKAEEQAAFEKKLIDISEQSVAKASQEAEGITSKVKATKTWLLVGGGVVALGIIGYVLMKKK